MSTCLRTAANITGYDYRAVCFPVYYLDWIFLYTHALCWQGRIGYKQMNVFADHSLHYQVQWWDFMNMVINHWIHKSR
jgi:hypothetical protein